VATIREFRFEDAKKLSAMALSGQLPLRLIEAVTPRAVSASR